MDESTKLKPIKILRENVSALEIAKYYLEVEFSSLFKDIPAEQITKSINNLKDNHI